MTERIKSHLKTYKMKLTTLSPIFIGGGEESNLTNLQFVYDFNNKQLCIIDEAKFSKFLNQHKLTENFIEFIQNNKNPKLFLWFKENNLIPEKLDIFSTKKKLTNVNIKELNDVRLFIKNSNGNPYIPGSSIKGALRTKILFDAIKKNKETLQQKYWITIKNDLMIGKRSKEINNLENEVFGKMNDSIWRAISISDSIPLKQEDLFFAQKEDFSNNGAKPHKLPLYREYLKSYIPIYFTITIDTNLLIGTGYENIINMAQTDDFERYWENLLKSFDSKKLDVASIYMPSDEEKYKANFCIGAGAGFLTKTVTYALAPSKEEALSVVKVFLDKVFTKFDRYAHTKVAAHKHNEDTEISPRTLKLANDEGDYVNVGWCNLQMVEEIC